MEYIKDLLDTKLKVCGLMRNTKFKVWGPIRYKIENSKTY